ncbi:SET domain-containing protein [Corynespora cassiicola Philippines]|uniref:SET domain-containing protein n=1 Tax=Corynespora cassiicola Philippines TaxID=1448308 RepID=A0A2T2NNS4_CORCC|nr:SET domain-containing protein [Corynespora cassiicola Philippines]
MPPLRRKARTKFSDTNSSRSGSIASRSATPSGRQTSLQHLYKRYPNLGKPLSQKEWAGCKCEGECRPSSCSCLRDGAPCRQSCSCGPACAHQFPACACKASNGCGRWCPCFLTHHQCNPGCPCPAGTCDVEEDLPKVEVKVSTIKTAGFGLFAGEFIPKGRLIRRFEGEIVPTPSIEDWDLFDISKGKFLCFSCPKHLLTFPGGHSIQIAKEGAFYINEKPFSEANAEFRYMEGRRRREVVARAKRDILPGEEIFAQYSDGTQWVLAFPGGSACLAHKSTATLAFPFTISG